ncbi:MAG: tetratricopeptide repeat protein [Candidatus Omnitrophota bacterium]
MKKINLIITILFLSLVVFFSAKIITAQGTRIALDEIIEDIPEQWWDGGWNKIEELTNFIQQNQHKNQEVLAKAQYWIGCNYYAIREHKRAIAAFAAIMEKYPESWLACAKAQFEIGQVNLHRLYDYNNALSAYTKVLREYPECEVSAQAQRMIAYTYFQMKDYAKAKGEYEKVWQNYPNVKMEAAKAYWELGEMLFQQCFEPGITDKEKNQKVKESLSAYKQAYLYCPSDEADVSEWTIDSIVRAFKYLDCNTTRADQFIQYQRYIKTGDNSAYSADAVIIDPLKDF